MKNALPLLLAVFCGCSRPRPDLRPRNMELWYWHHSYLVSAEAVHASETLIDRAAKAGYTGLVLWDSGLVFLGTPNWPASNVDNLREVIQYAVARGLRVLPLVAPYGHSNDMLIANPNWAEGQRVIGTRFRVSPDGRKLVQIRSISERLSAAPQSFLKLRLRVIPWRQYHIRLRCKTAAFRGQAQLEVYDGPANRLDADLHPPADRDWTHLDYTFNSASSASVEIAAGAVGPHTGILSIDRVDIEETALVYVLRRSGTPLRLYDPAAPARVFQEALDFNPVHDAKLLANPRFDHDNYHDPGPVTVPAGSRLKPGQVVAIDYYAVAPVYDEAVGACLTEPAVERWVLDNARTVARLAPHGSGLFLSHDEMRQMNSCAACRAKNMSAGDLLAWSFRRLAGELDGSGPLYVWNDMFDPYHNAHDHFSLVEGTLAGSWRGLPPGVTVMNWNLNRLTPSLTWFSGDDPRQPVPHRQVIAGFYDPPDRDGAEAARREMNHAAGIPGVAGMMYTTWTDDYSQLESYAAGARKAWARYLASRPL